MHIRAFNDLQKSILEDCKCGFRDARKSAALMEKYCDKGRYDFQSVYVYCADSTDTHDYISLSIYKSVTAKAIRSSYEYMRNTFAPGMEGRLYNVKYHWIHNYWRKNHLKVIFTLTWDPSDKDITQKRGFWDRLWYPSRKLVDQMYPTSKDGGQWQRMEIV